MHDFCAIGSPASFRRKSNDFADIGTSDSNVDVARDMPLCKSERARTNTLAAASGLGVAPHERDCVGVDPLRWSGAVLIVIAYLGGQLIRRGVTFKKRGLTLRIGSQDDEVLGHRRDRRR